MDFYQSGIICTKHKLWKKKNTVLSIIDSLISKGYQFEEMVFGEPNDFVFSETYDNVIPTLSRKGNFFGIRIKFASSNYSFSIDSNTMGVDNVRFDIYADSEELLKSIKNDCLELITIIGATNESLTKGSEYLANNRKLVYTVVIILTAILMYFLGAYVFLFDIIYTIFSFAPILIIILLFSYFRRR